MTLNFEDEWQKPLEFDPEAVAKEVIEGALEYENCPYEAEVSLTLTDNASIHEINRSFRQIDAPTDVLSFPMNHFPKPAEYAMLEEAMDAFNPESGELLLGDIVISMERAAEQAKAYGHSMKREYAFLIAHSMLHLLGYDHMLPEEAKQMERRQGEILDQLGITRDQL
jgi:probable rRNA maturation factor